MRRMVRWLIGAGLAAVVFDAGYRRGRTAEEDRPDEDTELRPAGTRVVT